MAGVGKAFSACGLIGSSSPGCATAASLASQAPFVHGPRDWAAATAGGPSSVVPDYLGRVTEASCHGPVLCGLQVREVAAEAIARARRGDGPTLIEAETYRFRGHSLADPDELRQKEEKDHYQVRPPALWLSCLLGGHMCIS